MGPKCFLSQNFSLFIINFKKLGFSAPLSQIVRYNHGRRQWGGWEGRDHGRRQREVGGQHAPPGLSYMVQI